MEAKATGRGTVLKDLIVPMTSTPGDAAALEAAVGLAKAHDAYVTVLVMTNLPTHPVGPWGFGPDVGMDRVYAKLRAQGQRSVVKLQSQLDKRGISSEVRMVESLTASPRMAAHLAHCADLAIVAGAIGSTAESETTRAYFGSLLLESGRPVLVVPPACKTPMPPKRVVMAWRPTTEAARALHDAMPLLIGTDAVDLLLVDTDLSEPAADLAPGADIAKHLARYGVNATIVVRKSRGKAVSRVLLDHAEKVRANLLVVGGYGHSRFREWALGGVTRELLLSAPIPVLYSH